LNEIGYWPKTIFHTAAVRKFKKNHIWSRVHRRVVIEYTMLLCIKFHPNQTIFHGDLMICNMTAMLNLQNI